jgi:hypothetical protein
VQVLRLCQKTGLVQMGQVALDGYGKGKRGSELPEELQRRDPLEGVLHVVTKAQGLVKDLEEILVATSAQEPMQRSRAMA